MLADLGYFDRRRTLDDYTRLGSPFGDHPDMKKVPGVDFSSGSLGHGLSAAVGIALGGRISGSDHRTWCMLGDGELCRGPGVGGGDVGRPLPSSATSSRSSTATSCASTATPTTSWRVEPIDDRFAAFGWHVQRIDGHDLEAILAAFSDLPRRRPRASRRRSSPTRSRAEVWRAWSCRLDWHVGNLVGEDYDDVMAELAGGL